MLLPGTYQVALQVIDSAGNIDTSVLTVTVNPVSYTGPTADAGPNQGINAEDSTSFSGSYSDPDGTVSSSGITWDFNYDSSTKTLVPSQITTFCAVSSTILCSGGVSDLHSNLHRNLERTPAYREVTPGAVVGSTARNRGEAG